VHPNNHNKERNVTVMFMGLSPVQSPRGEPFPQAVTPTASPGSADQLQTSSWVVAASQQVL